MGASERLQGRNRSCREDAASCGVRPLLLAQLVVRAGHAHCDRDGVQGTRSSQCVVIQARAGRFFGNSPVNESRPVDRVVEAEDSVYRVMPLVAGKSNKGNGIFSTMFDQKRDMTRASLAGGRAISMLVLAATLAACAMPGMRMQELPTLPADGASNTTDTHDVSVPISAIDMALIRNMRDQAMQDQSATGADLFAAPGAY